MPRPSTMRAVQVPEPGAAFELVDRPLPDPGPGEVRVAVDACGVCHSDGLPKEGHPAVSYPRVPGHEVVGRVDAVGGRVEEWSVGDRVGVGWHGGHCFTCEDCRRGNFRQCDDDEITGLTRDGGYAEYTLARREALAAVPESLADADAAPLLCAGVTTFNALRNADAAVGDLVAVVGIGGLGHLGVQYARAAGFETVAVSRGPEKESVARELGADHYVDSEATDPAAALRDLGGASVVLATAPAGDAIADTVGGLATNGDVVAVGIPEAAVPVNVAELVDPRCGLRGWSSGHARDSQDALEFSALRDVTPRVETFDLADADAAFEAMRDGVRFRAVVEP